jgi:hypothetical protein
MMTMFVILSEAKNLSCSGEERQRPFASLRVTRNGGGKL